MERPNDDIRFLAKKKGVTLWRVADFLGVQDSALSREMRYDLPRNRKTEVENAIMTLAGRAGK